jgi:hypothetical protein
MLINRISRNAAIYAVRRIPRLRDRLVSPPATPTRANHLAPEQSKTECLARHVWCFSLAARRRGRCRGGSPGCESAIAYYFCSWLNLGNFLASFGLSRRPSRRRRPLTARVIPIPSLAELYILRRLAQLLFPASLRPKAYGRQAGRRAAEVQMPI